MRALDNLERLPAWSRLVLGAVVALAAWGIRVPLSPLIGEEFAFATFYPALVVAAVLFGFGGGIACMLSALAIASLWVVSPIGRLSWDDPTHSAASVIFVVSGVLISAVGAMASRSRVVAAELTKSEERYRAIVESQSEMVSRFRLDGTLVFVNEAYARSRGSTPRELEGANLWQWIPEADRPAVRRLLGGLSPAHPSVTIENRFETKEGPRWMMWTNRALSFDAAGRPVELQATGIDITERKRAELALRESEQRFRLMADAAPVLIWLSGADRLCYWFNRTWLEFVGRPMEELVGNRWLQGVHEEDRERVISTYAGAFEAREPFSVEYRLRRKDGEYRWMMDHGVPRFDPGGLFAGYIGSCLDITVRRDGEEALKRSVEELERFVSIASHDLKEPLRGVAMLAQYIREDAGEHLDEESRTRLARITQLCKRMTEMIDALLEYAKAGGKRRDEECDLDEITRRAIDSLSETIARERVEISVRGRLPLVPGDSMLLERAITNLIANAVRHNNSERRMVEIGVEGGEVYVRDNGPGIEARHHARIFEMFKRAPGGGEGGVGAGLALVKNIVESHGGKIRVISAPGEGATFYMRLPGAVMWESEGTPRVVVCSQSGTVSGTR